MVCGNIYTGNKKQTFKKTMDRYFSNVQRILKNRQKLDSFAVHDEKYFKSTTALNDMCNCETLKLAKQINTIG